MIWRLPVSFSLTLIGRYLIRYDDHTLTILGACAGVLGMWMVIAAYVVVRKGFQ